MKPPRLAARAAAKTVPAQAPLRAAAAPTPPAATRRTPKSASPPATDIKLEIEAERETPERRIWWWVGIGAGAVLLAVTTLLAHKHALTGLNLAAFRHINGLPDGLRLLALIIIVSANSLLIGAAAVVVTFLLKLYQLSWQLAAAVLTAGFVGEVAKKVIAEPRPPALVPNVHARVLETDAGFPSGHTLIATVVVLTLWPYLPKGWRWLVVAYIPLMGLARIYLGVHAPLDVAGGFALGLLIVSCMRVLPERMRRFFRLD